MEKIAIIGDIHLPFQDDRVLNYCLNLIKKEKPDMIVANGDILDFPGLSRYNQVPNFVKSTLTDELSLGWSFFSDLRRENPKAEIVFIEGNHEFRLRSYTIRLAPNLYDCIDLERDLKLKDLRIKYIRTQEGTAKWTDTFIDVEGIKIGHWDNASNPIIPAGMTIRSIMQKKVKINSVVQSHIHRAAIIWDTNEEGKARFGLEVPCLCKNPFYTGSVNWQRGMAFIDKTESGWQPRLIIL